MHPLRPAPTLTLFCGLPGSGKTTLARRLAAERGSVRLCTDEWQAAIGIPAADSDGHERLQRLLYAHALTLLRAGCDVILEDGLWFAAERAEKFADGRSAGARIELHVLEVDVEELWTRLQVRNAAARPGDHPMTADELTWAAGLFEPPSEEELRGVDEVVRHGAGRT